MKTFPLVLCALVMAIHSNAQLVEPPKAFAEIPWRTPMADAAGQISQRSGMQVLPSDTSASRLAYTGGSFVGKPAHVWGFEFVGDGFYRGAVVLKAVGDRAKQVAEIKMLITSKYGQPKSTQKVGKNSVFEWRFPATGPKKDAVLIALSSNTDGDGPKVTYRNESMGAGGGASGNDL